MSLSDHALLQDHAARPQGKPPARPARVRDLRHLIGRVADEAGLTAVSQGLTLYVDIDPALRGPWSLNEAGTRQALESFTAAALRGRWGEARLGARLGPARLEVTATAPAGPAVPDEEAVRRLARHARTLGARLDVGTENGAIAWRLLAPLRRPIPRLLYVDDAPGARVEMTAMARTLGWRCDAADARAAEVRLASGESYDVVLVELDADGALALAGAVSAYPFAPTMIAVAREGASGWALRQAGFLGLVRKPLDERRLARALSSVEAAEFVDVKRAKDGEHDHDDEDREHGAVS